MESRVKGTVKLRLSDVMMKVLKVINTSSDGFEAAVKRMARLLFIADAAAYCRVVSLLAGGMPLHCLHACMQHYTAFSNCFSSGYACVPSYTDPDPGLACMAHR